MTWASVLIDDIGRRKKCTDYASAVSTQGQTGPEELHQASLFRREGVHVLAAERDGPFGPGGLYQACLFRRQGGHALAAERDGPFRNNGDC